MKLLCSGVAVFLLSLFALAQNECAAFPGSVPVQNMQSIDSAGIRHQLGCVDTSTGKLILPYNLSISASGTLGSASFNATSAPPFLFNGVQLTSLTGLSDGANLCTLTGTQSLTNKNLIGANPNNSVSLLAPVAGPATGIAGNGAIQALYKVNVPPSVPGAGKCIHAHAAWTKAAGAGNTCNYNWSFTAHNAALVNSGVGISTNNATGVMDQDIELCNTAGVQNSQILIQHQATVNTGNNPGGVSSTAIDMTSASGTDLAITFNCAADTVTPQAFLYLDWQ